MFKIALDGPSGAGKSVMAKAVAKKLGFLYVDTGALYRAVGLYCFRNGIGTEESEKIVDSLKKINLEMKHENGTQTVYLNGEDVNKDIRLPEISMYASAVSKLPEVRAFLLDIQRGVAEKYNVIMDGRDIGTVIFPDAQVKIFLFANDKVRAERRYKELCEKGIKTTFDEVYNDMLKRDENDRTRKIAPALPAKDAIMLDNSYLTAEETENKIIEIVEEKRK